MGIVFLFLALRWKARKVSRTCVVCTRLSKWTRELSV